MSKNAIEFRELSFSFEHDGATPIFSSLSAAIPAGARVLLVGANGVGKSTLLRILGGKHLIPVDPLSVLGRSPFHDLALAQKICWIGGELGITLDIQVRELLGQKGTSKRLEAELLELFEISPSWRMCRVSDGQRRRVQLLLGLRSGAEILLLDEVTAHLDVTMRSDFLSWLKRDTLKRGTTIIYATHIFDGLEGRVRWPSHLLWLGFGGQSRFGRLTAFRPELERTGSLGRLCETLIRKNLSMRNHGAGT